MCCVIVHTCVLHKNKGEIEECLQARFKMCWCSFRYAVTLLDAPGHQDFVPNLITGVAQADAALLIVDGAPGGFEAGFGTKQQSSGGARTEFIGQTREHVHVARSAGIKQLAVVVTKLDMCEYKQERFEEIKGQLAPFLKSCGYSQPDWLPVSAPDGQNVASAPSDPRLLAWWGDSNTLVDAIDSFQPVTQHLSTFSSLSAVPTLVFRNLHARFSALAMPSWDCALCSRMCWRQDMCRHAIDIVFCYTDLPFRLVITDMLKQQSLSGKAGVCGKIETGAVMVGQQVLVMPAGLKVAVKDLQVLGRSQPVAIAGDSVDIGLSGVDDTDLDPGSTLCHPEYPIQVATRIQVCSTLFSLCYRSHFPAVLVVMYYLVEIEI